ncbi:MAG: hypothetical protein KDB00_15385, partial [Planctomycetales bacterium]|nr:hypothetical protein [Planctomycetales bacterium]
MVEALENRLLLATDVPTFVDNVFQGTDREDVLTLSNHADPGKMQLTAQSLDSEGQWQTRQWVFENPSDTLVLNLLDGDDEIHLLGLDPGFAGALIVNGDSPALINAPSLSIDEAFSVAIGGGVDVVHISGDIPLNGGSLTINSEIIQVAPATSISTRVTDINGVVIGDSGNIELNGQQITIGAGASLMADVGSSVGRSAGDIVVRAFAATVVRSLSGDPAAAEIKLDEATIHGGNISLYAEARERFGVYGFKKSATAKIDVVDSNLVGDEVVIRSMADTSLLPDVPSAELTGDPELTFNHSDELPDVIRRSSGNWIEDGFLVGHLIDVVGTASNDGSYLITVVTPQEIVLTPETVLIEETVQGAAITGETMVPSPEDILENLSPFTGAAFVTISDVESTVDLRGTTMIQSPGDVKITSESISRATPVARAIGIPAVFNVNAVWAESSAIGQTLVRDSTQITAGNLVVEANSDNQATATALGIARNRPVSLSFAYVEAETKAEAMLGTGTNVIANDVDVHATSTNEVTAASAIVNSGQSGVSASAAYSQFVSDTNATIAGQVTATGDVSVDAYAETTSHITEADARNLGNTKESGTQVSNYLNRQKKKAAGKTLDITGAADNESKATEFAKKILFPEIKSGLFNLAGSVVLVNSTNRVQAEIAPTAVVAAAGNVNVNGETKARQYASAVAQSSSDSVALGGSAVIATYENLAAALIAEGAVVDASGSINVTSKVDIPHPWDIDFTSSDEVLNALGNSPLALLFTSFSRNSSAGDNFGASGMANIIKMRNEATASIGRNARVNTDPSFASATQSVNVFAETDVNTMNVIGADAKFGLLDKLLNPLLVSGSEKLTTKYGALQQLGPFEVDMPEFEELQNPKAGLGGSFALYEFDNSARAFIADQAIVNAGGDVSVTALSTDRHIALTTSQGGTDKLAVLGSGSLIRFRGTTIAFVSPSATIDAGDDFMITANSDPHVYNLTGSLSSGASIGIGVSVGVTQVDTVTKAFVGDEATLADAPSLQFRSNSVTGTPTLIFEDGRLTGNPIISFRPVEDQGDVIARDQGSWVTDGFRPGQYVTVSTESQNAGSYLVTEVSDNELVLQDGLSLIDETLAGVDISVAPTITRNSGSWLADGFLDGQSIRISGSNQNDGEYKILSADDSRLTLRPDTILRDETASNVLVDADDTISRSEGSWRADGFRPGQTITVSGTVANDGEYEVIAVDATTLTLRGGSNLTNESGVAADVFSSSTTQPGSIRVGDHFDITAQSTEQIIAVSFAGSLAFAEGKQDPADAVLDEEDPTPKKLPFSIAGAGEASWIEAQHHTLAYLEHAADVSAGSLFVDARNGTAETADGLRLTFLDNGTAADSILRDSGSWLDVGMRPGQIIYVANTDSNNGYYEIASVTESELILASHEQLTPEVTRQAEFRSGPALGDQPELKFANNPVGRDTVTRSRGSWLVDGFREGMEIRVSDSNSNNGTYTIESLTHEQLTLKLLPIQTQTLVNETSSTARVTGVGSLKTASFYAGSGALALGFGNKSAAAAGSFSTNSLYHSTRAWVSQSIVSASDDLIVHAFDPTSFYAVAASVGGSAGVSADPGSKANGALSGNVSLNSIQHEVVAEIVDSGIDARALSVSAKDSSNVRVDSGALGFAVATGGEGTGGAGSFGFSFALNEFNSSVNSVIHHSRINTVDDVVVVAVAENHLESLTIAGSTAAAAQQGFSGSLAGAGAVAFNEIVSDVSAEVLDSTVTTSGGGDLSVNSRDRAVIGADAGGVALALAASQGSGNSLAAGLGASVARTTISDGPGGGVRAVIDEGTVNVTGAVVVRADVESLVDTVTIAGSGALGGSSNSAITASGAGAESNNHIERTIAAGIGVGSTIIASGSVDVDSTDASQIRSRTVGATVSASGGSSGTAGALAVGASLASNFVANNVTSVIDDGILRSGGQVTVSAASQQRDLFTLLSEGPTGLTALQLDDLAFQTGDDEETENVDESAQDIADDAALRARLVAQFADAGESIDQDSKVSLLAEGRGWLVVDEVGGRSFTIAAQSNGQLVVQRTNIDSIAVAASLSGAIGQNGIALAGGGASTENVFLTKTRSEVIGSEITAIDGLNVQAFNTSGISSTVIAVSVSIGIGTETAGVAASIGAAVARNFIGIDGQHREAAGSRAIVDDSTLDLGEDVNVRATTAQTVSSVVFAGSVAVSGSSNSGLSLSGAGVSATNEIAADATAELINMNSPGAISAQDVVISAQDVSMIRATAGAVSVAVAATGEIGGAVALGLGLAQNTITTEVLATMDSVVSDTVSSSLGSITLAASESASIDAIAFAATASVAVGGSGGLAFSGAGAEATNRIQTKTDAAIIDSNLAVDGNVIINATNDASIDALVLSLSIGVGAGGQAGAGAALGVAVAQNLIGDGSTDSSRVRAFVEGATIDASAIAIDADVSSTITALTIGGAIGVGAGGSGGVGVGAAGAGSQNVIKTTIEAAIKAYAQPNSPSIPSDITTTGDVTLNANDNSHITANGGGIGVAVGAGGSGGVAASLGVSFAKNDIGNQVRAIIADSNVRAGGQVSLSAMEMAQIDALTIGGAVAVGAGGAGGVGASVAGAGSFNEIRNQVEASIRGSAKTVQSTGGGVSLSATDHSTIIADAGGVGAAVGAGGAAGVSASFGFSAAENTVENSVRSNISGTTVLAFGDIDLTASEQATIDALTIGGAVAVGAGGAAGIGVGAAGAGSGNTIRNQVEASLRDGANVETTTGSVALSATDDSSIYADGGAIGLAVAAGGAAGVGVSLGVGYASNLVENQVRALITGSDVTAAAGQVTLTATENASIQSLSIGGAVSVGAAAVLGENVAGAGAGSYSTIGNTVEAEVTGGAIVHAGGPVTISATDSSTIIANAGGAAAGVGAGIVGVSVAVGGSVVRNEVANTVRASVDGATVTSKNNLTIEAYENATIKGSAIGGAAAVAGGLVGVAAGVGFATVDNSVHSTVEALAKNSQLTTSGAGDIVITATDNSTLDAKSVAGALSIAGGISGTSVAVGTSLADNSMGNAVYARSENTTLVSDGSMTLSATSTPSAKAFSVAAALGVSAAPAGVSFSGGGARSSNNLNNDVASLIQAGSATAAGDISLIATEIADLGADVGSGAIAASAIAASAAVSIGSSNSNSTVRAGFDDATVKSTSGDVSVNAFADGQARSDVSATSIAAGTFTISGAGADARATFNPSVDAHVNRGSLDAAAGSISVRANASPKAIASSRAYSGATITTVGVSLSDTFNSPKVDAAIGGVVTAAGDIVVDASINLTNTADADAVAAAVVASGSRTEANAFSAPKVDSHVAAGSSITSTSGDIHVLSSSSGDTTSGAYGETAAGVVAVGQVISNAAVGDNVAVDDVDEVSVDNAITLVPRNRLKAANTDAYLGSNSAITAGGSIYVDADAVHRAIAKAKGGQSGAIALGASAANAGRNNPVTAEAENGAVLTAGRNIFITATNGHENDYTNGNVVANAENDSRAALVGASAPRSRTTVNSTTDAILGASVVVIAPRGSFTLNAVGADFGIQSHANTAASGLVALPDAQAYSTVNHPVKAKVGHASTIDVGVNISIESDVYLLEYAIARTSGKGLGSKTFAKAETSGFSSALTEIGAVDLNAGLDIQLVARQPGAVRSTADSETSGGSLGLNSTTDSRVTKDYSTEVIIYAGADIVAPGQLSILADDFVADANLAIATTRAGGAIGGSNAHAYVGGSKRARVYVENNETVESRTTMRTSNLQVHADAGAANSTPKASRPGFALIKGGSQTEISEEVQASSELVFYANVTITGQSALLIIDANGNEIARSGVTYTTTPGQYVLDPIVNLASGVANLRSSGLSQRIVSGDADFTFEQGSGSVTLINDFAGRELVVDDITMFTNTSANLFVTPAHVESETEEFRTHAPEVVDSRVDILGQSNVILTGVINNTFGVTSITAETGSITRDNGPQLVLSREIDLDANSIGTIDRRVQSLIRGSNSANDAVRFTANSHAGNSYLTLGYVAPSTFDPPLLSNAEVRGDIVDIRFEDRGATSSFEIGVAANELNADAGINTPINVAFTALDGRDLAVGTVTSRLGDISLSSPEGAIRATQPGGATDVSGRNLSFTANTTIGAENNPLFINSAASGSGVVTATANGSITLREVAGDLALAQVASSQGNVYLESNAKILNGNPTSTSLINVIANAGQATLLAQSGIGASGNYLTTDVRYLEGYNGSGGLLIHNLGGNVTIGGNRLGAGLASDTIVFKTIGGLTIQDDVLASGPIFMSSNFMNVEEDTVVRSNNASTTLEIENYLETRTGSRIASPSIVTLQGLGNADHTFNVYGSLSANRVDIIGEGGVDRVQLFQYPDAPSTYVTLGEAYDFLTVYGTAANDRFDITKNTITLDTSRVINYQGINELEVLSLLGNDTFNVTGTSVLGGTWLEGRGTAALNVATDGTLNAPVNFMRGNSDRIGLNPIHVIANALNAPLDTANVMAMTDIGSGLGKLVGLGLDLTYRVATSFDLDLNAANAELYLLKTLAETRVRANGSNQTIWVGGAVPGSTIPMLVDGPFLASGSLNLATIGHSLNLAATGGSGSRIEFNNQNGVSTSAQLFSDSIRGLGEAPSAQIHFTGFDSAGIHVGDGDLTVMDTIAGPVDIHINAGDLNEPNNITVLKSPSSRLNVQGESAFNEIVFDAATYPALIAATFTDGAAPGSTNLNGFGPIGPATLSAFNRARLISGSASDTFAINSSVGTMVTEIEGGAGDDLFVVSQVGVATTPNDEQESMVLIGQAGNDTVHVPIPGLPSAPVHAGLMSLASNVEHLIIDNTTNPLAVNWDTESGTFVGYKPTPTSVQTPLLDMSLVEDVTILGGTSDSNTLTVNAGGVQQKGTIDDNKVTLQSAGVIQFARLFGTVSTYSEGGFTLRSSTMGGAPNLQSDRSITPAIKSANPSSGTPIQLTATDGGIFSLFSLALSGIGSTTLVGTKATGEIVTQQIDVAQPDAFETFELNRSFSKLVSVSFDLGSLLATSFVAKETLRPGPGVTIDPVLGYMPNAPQNIVFDGYISVEGVTNTYASAGGTIYGLINGTPYSIGFNNTVDGGGSYVMVYGDLNIPDGSIVTIHSSSLSAIYVQNDVNIGENVTFRVPAEFTG